MCNTVTLKHAAVRVCLRTENGTSKDDAMYSVTYRGYRVSTLFFHDCPCTHLQGSTGTYELKKSLRRGARSETPQV
jgi:hypothetical protein